MNSTLFLEKIAEITLIFSFILFFDDFYKSFFLWCSNPFDFEKEIVSGIEKVEDTFENLNLKQCWCYKIVKGSLLLIFAFLSVFLVYCYKMPNWCFLFSLLLFSISFILFYSVFRKYKKIKKIIKIYPQIKIRHAKKDCFELQLDGKTVSVADNIESLWEDAYYRLNINFEL